MIRLQFEYFRLLKSREFTPITLLTLALCFIPFSRYGRGVSGGDSYPLARISSVIMRQSNPTKVAQPLKMTAEIVGQRYCKDSAKTFSVIFRLRVGVMNQSDKNVIVEKTPGLGQYSIVISHDEKSLSQRKHEYDPISDWTTEPLSPETPEKFKSPGPEFAILGPGDSLQTETWIRASLVGRQQGSEQTPGTIPAGDHVLQVTFTTWDFQTQPQEIRKRWEPFGYLVYDSLSTGPLSFSLPQDPKLENCK